MPWSDKKQAKKIEKIYHQVTEGSKTFYASFEAPEWKSRTKLNEPDTSAITSKEPFGYDRLEKRNAENTFHVKATGGQLYDDNMRRLVKQAPIELENPMSANNVVDSVKLELYKDGQPFECYGLNVISASISAELEANVNTFEFIGGNGSYKQLINSGDYSVNIDFVITPGGITPLLFSTEDNPGGRIGSNPQSKSEILKPEYKDLKQFEGILKKTNASLQNAAAWANYQVKSGNAGRIARKVAAAGTTFRQFMHGNQTDLMWYLQRPDGMTDYDMKPDNELQLLCTLFRFVCKYPYSYQLHVTNRYLNMLGVEYLCPVRWRTDTTDEFTNTYRLSLEAHGEYGY